MSHKVTRTQKDIQEIEQPETQKKPHQDSRKAAWAAISAGSEVIREIQQLSPKQHGWERLEQALSGVNPAARQILEMRLEALGWIKRGSHHREGYRLSQYVKRPLGPERPPRARNVTSLCLISGHEGQEIPGLVAYDRVMVDAEHMEQALGPATVAEILRIRKLVGEYVYISTNVSETPQLVRDLKTGQVDTRATAALTAAKVISALDAGTDVVKVGFAHLDPTKRDLTSAEVTAQMKLVRDYISEAVQERALFYPLSGQYPLISVFFPEIGIDSHGESPLEIAKKAIEVTAAGGWQGVLIDTFEKHTGKRYKDFYSLEDTRALAGLAHEAGLEFWIAGSIREPEVRELVKCKVDLICFGGAARNPGGMRGNFGGGTNAIKRELVEGLVRAFEETDPRLDGSSWAGLEEAKP